MKADSFDLSPMSVSMLLSYKDLKPALISCFGYHFQLTVNINVHCVYLFDSDLKCLKFFSEKQ